LRVLSLVWLMGCVHNPQPSTREVLATDGGSISGQLTRLEGWMIGRFDNAAQASSDASFPRASLSACKVDSPLGPRVLYLELRDAAGAPVRQWLYALGTDGDRLRARSYALSSPASLVGLCERAGERRVDAGYVERRGCELWLRSTGDAFEGKTEGNACAPEAAGPRYVTSELRVLSDRLEAWDRGYDGAGSQVAGSVKGPLRLVRAP
jgi:hypothetical protein